MVEPHTFGGTRASEVLAKMLNEKYPQCTTKVGAYYAHYTRDLKGFSCAWQCFPNGGLMELMLLHKKNRFETIKQSSLPEEIKRFLFNVLCVAYNMKSRSIRRLYELNKPEKLSRKYQVSERVVVVHDIRDDASGMIIYPRGSHSRVTKFFKVSEGCYEYVLDDCVRVADYYLEKVE